MHVVHGYGTGIFQQGTHWTKVHFKCSSCSIPGSAFFRLYRCCASFKFFTLNNMATKVEGTTQENNDSSDKTLPGDYHAKSYSRLSKDNVYMILALLMEDFVDKNPEGFRKVGAVLALPNDFVCAVDCTRDDVHAVERLLIKHFDKAEGSIVFMSRKPCPVCAKLLVQTKVKRVLYLPFKPEYYISPSQNPEETATTAEQQTEDKNAENMQQVDNIFTASPIAQTKFVLQLHKVILDEKEEKKKTQEKEGKVIKKEQENLLRSKYPTKWMDYMEAVSNDNSVSRRVLKKL